MIRQAVITIVHPATGGSIIVFILALKRTTNIRTNNGQHNNTKKTQD
jgi:hypothetical protein